MLRCVSEYRSDLQLVGSERPLFVDEDDIVISLGEDSCL